MAEAAYVAAYVAAYAAGPALLGASRLLSSIFSEFFVSCFSAFSSPEPFSLGHSLKIRLWFTRPNGKI